MSKTPDERYALEIIGAAVPMYEGDTIATLADRLVASHRAAVQALREMTAVVRHAQYSIDVASRPPLTEAQREAAAVADLGGTRRT